MAIEQLPHPSCTSAWGLQWFSPPMPTVLLITLRGHALRRWEQETGFPWGSRSRNRTNKRCVLAADLPVECAAMFAEWLLASASQVHWTADHRKVLSRPTADHLADLQDAGFGYAPPSTGELRVHRDSEDGFTVLIALDAVLPSGGSVCFLPYSDGVHLPDHRLPKLTRTWGHSPYEFTASDAGLGCMFRASTLHWGRANVSTAGRIIINATLGCTERVRVQEAREQVPPDRERVGIKVQARRRRISSRALGSRTKAQRSEAKKKRKTSG